MNRLGRVDMKNGNDNTRGRGAFVSGLLDFERTDFDFATLKSFNGDASVTSFFFKRAKVRILCRGGVICVYCRTQRDPT